MMTCNCGGGGSIFLAMVLESFGIEMKTKDRDYHKGNEYYIHHHDFLYELKHNCIIRIPKHTRRISYFYDKSKEIFTGQLRKN